MNKHPLLFLTAAVLFCLISCSKQTTYNYPDTTDICFTKSMIESENNRSDDYFVSRKDIDAYLHYKKLLVNNTSFGVKSVDPLIYNSEQTLGYIINYNDGWEIVSGDKRTPITIAYAETGQLTTENLKQSGVYSALKTWLDGLMNDIQSIHDNPNYYLDNLDYSKGVVQSLDFWNAITNPDTFIKEHTTETKALSDPFPGNGHWVLISVTTTSQNSTVNLTTTQWGQNYPYNYYCPPPSQGSQTNSLVGCVAVAGAQQLYYLHNYLGQPSSAPTSVSFTGYGPDQYTMSVGPFSNSVWQNMNSGYSDETGVLLAYVGGQVSMNYGSTFSSAYTEDLVDNVFNPNGLDCTIYYSLTTSLLYDNLLSGIPLVVAAKNPYYDNDRHSFLIDKYKKTDYTTIYTYEWVEDPIIEGNNQPRANQKQVIQYSTSINEIGMNWGWSGNYNNTWFTLSSNWIVGELNYSVVRLVIADFCVLDNA